VVLSKPPLKIHGRWKNLYFAKVRVATFSNPDV
jgi:hypothetical protein